MAKISELPVAAALQGDELIALVQAMETRRSDIDAIFTFLKTVDGATSGLDADLLDGQHGSFYTNADNLDAGTLPAARFTDTSHGSRGGGTLHPDATTSVAGFMSASDKTKIDSVESGATADQTASEILSLLLTVDGSGSGLDADVLDGIDSSSFVRGDNVDNGATTITVNGADFVVQNTNHVTPAYIYFDSTSSPGRLFLGTPDAVPQTREDLKTSFGDTYWHSGNDGSGSGLDADTIDGSDASDFVTITGAQTITGQKTFSTVLIQDDAVGRLQFLNDVWGGRVARVIAEDSGDLRIRPTSAADTDNSSHDFRYNNGTDLWEVDDDFKVGNDLYIATNTFNPAVANVVGATVRSIGQIQVSIDGVALVLNRIATNGATAQFRQDSNACGTISVDGNNLTTSYNTSSDRRLKIDHGILDSSEALSRLANIPIHKYGYHKSPEIRDIGVYAQEVVARDKELARTAVSLGSRESVPITDPDYEPHGVDYSKFVPLLISSCQALLDKVNTLEKEVALLKTKVR